ncbi:tRNA (adenosine(37)-N6)-threonylcarbamoyltransferase complex dimerization subunit type 1 TsaB [Aliidiomarina sp. Khilg15.8]
MSRLLAIDSATEFCSVAYTDGIQTLSRGAEIPRRHSQELLPYVNDVLAQAGVSLKQLDAIIVSQGPGSFTGVRIGASMAQGLAFSCDLPLVQVSTLAALAQASARLDGATHALPAIDARMGEVYFGTYQLQAGLMQEMVAERVCAPQAVSAPAVDSPWWACGTGWETYAEELRDTLSTHRIEVSPTVRLPHAEDMLVLGAARFVAGHAVAAEDLEPHYLRNEVTWQKLPGR